MNREQNAATRHGSARVDVAHDHEAHAAVRAVEGAHGLAVEALHGLGRVRRLPALRGGARKERQRLRAALRHLALRRRPRRKEPEAGPARSSALVRSLCMRRYEKNTSKHTKTAWASPKKKVGNEKFNAGAKHSRMDKAERTHTKTKYKDGKRKFWGKEFLKGQKR